MIVNLLVILITLITGSFYLNKNGINPNSPLIRKRFITFISLILILQSGLRNVAVGADTFSYYLSYESTKMMSWKEVFFRVQDYFLLDEGKDPGFTVFEKIAQLVIKDYQLFLVLIALIFFSALGSFLYKNTTRLSDAVFAFVLYSVLFYAFFSITGHRQTVATAATLYGFEFIKQRRLLPLIVLLLLASTIHKSVLVFLPFYFIYKLNSVRLYYSLLLFSFPILFINRIAISDIFKIIGGYSDYGVNQEAGTLVFTVMILFIAFITLLRYNTVVRNNPISKTYYLAFAVGLFFVPLTWVNPSAMRVVQYFSIFMLVLIPEVINSFQLFSLKTKRLVYSLAIISLLVLYIQSSYSIEYKFFWQEMQLGSNY